MHTLINTKAVQLNTYKSRHIRHISTIKTVTTLEINLSSFQELNKHSHHVEAQANESTEKPHIDISLYD